MHELETTNRDLCVDRINVDSETPAIEELGREECRAGVGKKVDHEIVSIGACSQDTLDALQRLLGIAAGDVLLDSVEDLLDVYPNVACPDGIGSTAFDILGSSSVDLLVVPAQYLGNLRVLRVDVKRRRAYDVIQQFLSNGHPVLLRSVPALIAHGDEAPRAKLLGAHHVHEVRQGLKSVVLICA